MLLSQVRRKAFPSLALKTMPVYLGAPAAYVRVVEAILSLCVLSASRASLDGDPAWIADLIAR